MLPTPFGPLRDGMEGGIVAIASQCRAITCRFFRSFPTAQVQLWLSPSLACLSPWPSRPPSSQVLSGSEIVAISWRLSER
eukprot:363229-Pyramimonas_sp.AAC.1